MTDPRLAKYVNGARRYMAPGRHSGEYVFPSVTYITSALRSEALIGWAAKVTAERAVTETEWRDWPDQQALAYLKAAHNEAKTKGGNRGTGVHEYMEKRLGGAPPGQALTGYQRAVEAFLDEVKPQAQLIETSVYCDKPDERWAGTTDFCGSFARVDGQPCLADWKTSKDLWPEAEMQLSAYALGSQFWIGEDGQEYEWQVPAAIYGVLFREDGSYAIRQVPKDQRYLQAFRACLELRTWQESGLKPLPVMANIGGTERFDLLTGALDEWLEKASTEQRTRLSVLCVEVQKAGVELHNRKAERTHADAEIMLGLIKVLEMADEQKGISA